MKSIHVENLTKIYGTGENEVVALNQISFSIEEGEFVAITGASGSGKSTLLYILAGLDKPTTGEVSVDHINLSSLSDNQLSSFRRKKVGLIYQFYNLIPTLTVEENIVLPVRLDKRELKKDRLENLLKAFHLEKKRYSYPSQLSGGEQQRVAIARSLFINPMIILADEPTGNLDSKNSKEVIAYLKNTNKKYNRTLIVVTHNMEIANEADRIIELSDGKIISDRKVR